MTPAGEGHASELRGAAPRVVPGSHPGRFAATGSGRVPRRRGGPTRPSRERRHRIEIVPLMPAAIAQQPDNGREGVLARLVALIHRRSGHSDEPSNGVNHEDAGNECSECVRGRLPLAAALRDELGPLLLAPALEAPGGLRRRLEGRRRRFERSARGRDPTVSSSSRWRGRRSPADLAGALELPGVRVPRAETAGSAARHAASRERC